MIQNATQNQVFRLKVSQFGDRCQFELTCGLAQCWIAKLDYPQLLDKLYADWQQAYLDFYQSKSQIPALTLHPSTPHPSTLHPSTLHPSTPDPTPLRARVVKSGNVLPLVDWQARLIDAETLLLCEFQNWLWQGELREISKVITAASRQLPNGAAGQDEKIDIFLTCDPLDLARLPWESWEITDDLAAVGKIRIARSPLNLRANAAPVQLSRGRQARILAICCDDAGLNLSQEKQILKSLEPLVSVTVVGWSTNVQQSIVQVQQDILTALEDEQGWDILFFAGHSDETQMTGGKLAIGPNASVTIEELKPYLMTAKNRGLQLAIFNSCRGLQIAESLIDLGVNQVIVMRERIHNQVAQEFLVQFVRSLSAYKDVQDSFQKATQLLQHSHHRIQYPSAYLVPSLFRRPGSPLLRLTPPSRRQWLRTLLPQNSYERAVVSIVSLLSLLPVVQTELLNQRALIQAQYRQLTQQIEPNPSPQLALIRIDDESISKDIKDIGNPNPMSHKYMGRLIHKLTELNVKVIGIDYLLDRPDPNSSFLSQQVKQATDRGVQLVFAKTPDNNGQWLKTPVEIADQRNVHADAVRAQGTQFHLPLQDPALPSALPLPFWLAWLHQACIQNHTAVCQTSITAQEVQAANDAKVHLPQIYQSRFSALASQLGNQLWLHPITDFSHPPQQAYTEIPAWKVLHDPNAPELRRISQQTAMIASGGYEEAGLVTADNVENFTPPAAVRHWYVQQNPQNPHRKMTGGEHMGYLFDQFLRQRLVMPIPDLWMVLLAAIVGKIMVAQLQKHPIKPLTHVTYLAVGTLAYTCFSLQLYLSSLAILLPIVLPITMLWAYVLPMALKRK